MNMTKANQLRSNPSFRRKPDSRKPLGRLGLSMLALAAWMTWSSAARAQEIVDAQAAPVLNLPDPPVPISLNMATAFRAAVNVSELKVVSQIEMDAVEAEAATHFANISTPPKRVGLNRSLQNLNVFLPGGASQRLADPNGNDLYTLSVRSPGAIGIRLHFTDFNVGQGSVLVYSDTVLDGLIVRGPFTGTGPEQDGDFWTAYVPGDTAYIEVTGTDAPQFDVPDLIHFDQHPGGLTASPADAADPEGLLGCHVDANCFATDTFGRDASGQMNFMVGTGNFLCSGTALNDFDGATAVPHFLTAFHCLSTQTSVNTLEVVWDWTTNACNGTLPSYASLPRSNGGQLLNTNSTNSGNDMTFIRLNGNAFTALAGFTTGGLPVTFVGYHHPSGSFRRGTQMHSELNAGPCTNRPTNMYHYLEMDNGITEGGSSGSAIFDGGDRVMGQLFGICFPTNITPGCTNREQYSSLYGRFNITFPIIERWLRIGGTINVNRLFVGVELGTPANPFNTVGEADSLVDSHNWTAPRIQIQAGTYSESVFMDERVDLIPVGGSVLIGG